MENTISITVAGVRLSICLNYARTELFFGKWLQPPQSGLPTIAVTKTLMEEAKRVYPSEICPEALEFNCLPMPASDALLPFRRCLFHGAAFLWRGKAWIFTAPSGTGKTTQYVLWKMLYGDEIGVLNGDKPVLESRDNSLWVHPSPWMGKEGMGRAESAPLGGVIYLAQGQENTIRLMRPRESVVPIFAQFLFTASGPEEVEQVCCLEEDMLRTVPVWLLTNRGDEASARLTHDTISQWEEHHHEG